MTTDDDIYADASAVMVHLRRFGIQAAGGDDGGSEALGAAVSHIAAVHPEKVAQLLLLGLIDLGLVSVMNGTLAAEVAGFTGESMEQVIERHGKPITGEPT